MDKEYSNEMRGTLWILDDSERKDKAQSRRARLP